MAQESRPRAAINKLMNFLAQGVGSSQSQSPILHDETEFTSLPSVLEHNLQANTGAVPQALPRSDRRARKSNKRKSLERDSNEAESPSSSSAEGNKTHTYPNKKKRRSTPVASVITRQAQKKLDAEAKQREAGVFPTAEPDNGNNPPGVLPSQKAPPKRKGRRSRKNPETLDNETRGMDNSIPNTNSGRASTPGEKEGEDNGEDSAQERTSGETADEGQDSGSLPRGNYIQHLSDMIVIAKRVGKRCDRNGKEKAVYQSKERTTRGKKVDKILQKLIKASKTQKGTNPRTNMPAIENSDDYGHGLILRLDDKTTAIINQVRVLKVGDRSCEKLLEDVYFHIIPMFLSALKVFAKAHLQEELVETPVLQDFNNLLSTLYDLARTTSRAPPSCQPITSWENESYQLTKPIKSIVALLRGMIGYVDSELHIRAMAEATAYQERIRREFEEARRKEAEKDNDERIQKLEDIRRLQRDALDRILQQPIWGPKLRQIIKRENPKIITPIGNAFSSNQVNVFDDTRPPKPWSEDEMTCFIDCMRNFKGKD
jgi:hypothetical protein